jgi:formate dehydrogenase subunit delta
MANASAPPSTGRNMPPEKLVYMANQIGLFFAAQDGETAPAAIAEHLTLFWDPRIRSVIVDHWRGGGAGLDPLVAKAVARLA